MFFLRNKIILFCFLVLLSCKGPLVHYDDLILENGRYQISNSKKSQPFTGIGFSDFDSGEISSKTYFKNGVPIGVGEIYVHGGDVLSTVTHELIKIKDDSEILRLNLLSFHELGSSKIDTSLNVITLKHIDDKGLIVKELVRHPILKQYEYIDIDCKLGEFEDPYMNLTLYKGEIK